MISLIRLFFRRAGIFVGNRLGGFATNPLIQFPRKILVAFIFKRLMLKSLYSRTKTAPVTYDFPVSSRNIQFLRCKRGDFSAMRGIVPFAGLNLAYSELLPVIAFAMEFSRWVRNLPEVPSRLSNGRNRKLSYLPNELRHAHNPNSLLFYTTHPMIPVR